MPKSDQAAQTAVRRNLAAARRRRLRGARHDRPRSPAITPEIVAEHGLSAEEYDRILNALGREPNLVELGIFSVMWSEHCSYKSSRFHLKKLPTEAPWVICGPGENAGVIDIGDGDAAIFKMESHNHPSYIEPYQGAATGVGGILRDVFTMGARPIANLNALALRPARPSQDAPPDRRRRRAASAATAIASAFRPSAARSISTPPMTATSWSTR